MIRTLYATGYRPLACDCTAEVLLQSPLALEFKLCINQGLQPGLGFLGLEILGDIGQQQLQDGTPIRAQGNDIEIGRQ